MPVGGADVLVQRLIDHGVEHVFGMPGSHSTAIYDALKRSGKIATVLVRNEQAGAFMADGFARVAARPGVVCTTAGPGATNALTGVAEAWADSVPLLLIAGQVNAGDLDRECGNYHEIDLEAIFRPVTKWCGTVRRVEQIAVATARAFQAMTTGRPRPAAIFVPQDLMRQPCATAISVASLEAPLVPELPRTDDRAGGGIARHRTPANHPGGRRIALVRGRARDPQPGESARLPGDHHAQWQGPA